MKTPIYTALKQHWNRFVVFGVSLMTLFSTFLVVPPTAGDEQTLYRFGSFCVAALSGLWLVPLTKWSSRSMAWRWWSAAIVLLVLSAGGFLLYSARLERWSVPYWGSRRVVTGETTTDDARKYRESAGRPMDDLELLKSYGGNAAAVWSEEEIDSRRARLGLLYLVTLLTLASTVITVSQAAYCMQGRGVKDPAKAKA